MQMENMQGRRITVVVEFTQREREIASMLATGLTNMEIAKELGISYNTVNTHIGNIRCKLGMRGQNIISVLNAVMGLFEMFDDKQKEKRG